jgi:hypothetical protein
MKAQHDEFFSEVRIWWELALLARSQVQDDRLLRSIKFRVEIFYLPIKKASR